MVVWVTKRKYASERLETSEQAEKETENLVWQKREERR